MIVKRERASKRIENERGSKGERRDRGNENGNGKYWRRSRKKTRKMNEAWKAKRNEKGNERRKE